MADKKKGIGDALIGLFVVRDGSEAEGELPPDPNAVTATASKGAVSTGDPAADDLIARYASGDASGKVAAKRPPSRPPSPQTLASMKASLKGGATAPAGTAETAPAAAATATVTATVDPAVAVPDVKVDFQAVLRKAGLSDEEQGRVDKALTLLHTLPAETPTEIKRQIVAASLQAFGIPVDRILESALLHIAVFEKHARAGETETQSTLEQSNRRLAELEREATRIRQTMQETRAHQQGLAFACSRQKMRVNEVLEFFGPEAVERARQSSVKLRDPKES